MREHDWRAEQDADEDLKGLVWAAKTMKHRKQTREDDIPVEISVVLGRTSMPVSNLLKLGRGAVVELDRKVGESLDIYVNERLVARGEVVIVENRIGVTLTEIIKSDK